MKEFKVLKYNEIVLLKLGIFSKNMDSIRGSSMPPIIFYAVLISVSFIVSLSLFVVENTAQFDVVLRNCLFILGSAQAFGMFISFCFNASNIQVIHAELQDIVDKSIATGMFRIVLKFTRKSKIVRIGKCENFSQSD